MQTMDGPGNKQELLERDLRIKQAHYGHDPFQSEIGMIV
jgi:hypothetical protein